MRNGGPDVSFTENKKQCTDLRDKKVQLINVAVQKAPNHLEPAILGIQWQKEKKEQSREDTVNLEEHWEERIGVLLVP